MNSANSEDDCQQALFACYTCCTLTGGGEDCKQRCTDCFEKCMNGNPNCSHECWPGPNFQDQSKEQRHDLRKLTRLKNVFTRPLIQSLRGAAGVAIAAGRERVRLDDFLAQILSPGDGLAARLLPGIGSRAAPSASRLRLQGEPALFHLLAQACLRSTRPGLDLVLVSRSLRMQRQLEGDTGFVGTKDVLLALAHDGERTKEDFTVAHLRSSIERECPKKLSRTAILALYHAEFMVADEAERPVTPDCLLIGILAQKEKSAAWSVLQPLPFDELVNQLASGLSETARKLRLVVGEHPIRPMQMVLPVPTQTVLKRAFREAERRSDDRVDTRHLLAGLIDASTTRVGRLLSAQGVHRRDLFRGNQEEV